MNSNNQENPRLFVDDECRKICGNRPGFEELARKIQYLLKEAEGPVQLQTNWDHDIFEIKIAEETDFNPEPSSCRETILAISIFVFFIGSLLVGIFQLGEWILTFIRFLFRSF